MHNPVLDLPANLPVPQDDGAAKHLTGKSVPELVLVSHRGRSINLHDEFRKKTVLFIFPRAGNTIEPNANVDAWDLVPGARGCTPQSCGYRDLSQAFGQAGFQVFGLSVQSPEILEEVATKNHLPFELLSDRSLQLTEALALPTFDFYGERLICRMALVIENSRILKVFYPVFPPDRNAAEVIAWINAGNAARP